MKYILYCRKSTDTEDKQMLSLDSQEHELLELAEKQGLDVIKTFRESMSAKSPGRPIFNLMLEMIENGKADSILCWKIDRLTRNPVDGGKLQWLLQTNKINCIQTFDRTYLPSDNVLLLSIEQAMANQYIRDLSTNVKRGNREKLTRGEWPNHAPFGYLNDKANKTIVVDKKLSKYVIRAYELYLTGNYGLREISNSLYEEGLRTKSGRKVLFSHIQRILTSIFYTGLMERDGKIYQGNHKPLVSKSSYDRVQQIMEERLHPKSKRLFFPLRGFLKCNNCGCALTASIKKGHHYYYCTNGKQNCEQHKSYLRENYLYDTLADIIDLVGFSERKIELMYQAAKEKVEYENSYLKESLITQQNQLESTKAKEAKLLDTYLIGSIPKHLFEEKSLELQNERFTLEERIRELRLKQPASTLERTREVFIQASRAKKDFLKGDDVKKKNILENFVWNFAISDRKVAQVKYKQPFHTMASAPKNGSLQEMLGDRESNPD